MFYWLNIRVLLFICASLLGVFFALVYRKYEHHNRLVHRQNTVPTLHETSHLYGAWLIERGLKTVTFPEEQLHYSSKLIKSEANFLHKEVPVLCVVWTKKKTQASAVKETWARNCNNIIFWGEYRDEQVPVLQITSSGVVRAIFLHVWKKYKNDFSWLLLVNDGTFVILENLRQYVAPLNSSKPYYLGHAVQHYATNYNLANAGIVLSHGAVSSIYETLFLLNDSYRFSSISNTYDEEIGYILKSCNISVMDTRDSQMRGRFNPFPPETMLVPGSISIFDSYWRSSLFLSNEGKDCCSDGAVTFHGMGVTQMHLLEYLVHSMAVFRNSPKSLANQKPPPIQWSRNLPSAHVTGKPMVSLFSNAKNGAWPFNKS